MENTQRSIGLNTAEVFSKVYDIARKQIEHELDSKGIFDDLGTAEFTGDDMYDAVLELSVKELHTRRYILTHIVDIEEIIEAAASDALDDYQFAKGAEQAKEDRRLM